MKMLTKDQMKKIMGGVVAPGDCSPLSLCSEDKDCRGPNGSSKCRIIDCTWENGNVGSYGICVPKDS